MKTTFKNRVFGCAVVKSINSNYNADFSHQPRTLPDGTAYATDKAFKYLVKNYLLQTQSEEKVLFFKRLNDEMNPLDLVGAFDKMFTTKLKDSNRFQVLKSLLSCIDVRLFGATFAPKGKDVEGRNISIHGTVQICHGINRYPESIIFSEQIMSPFANIKEKKGESESNEPGMTTLGSQSKLQEGHYSHHFSVNPGNLKNHLDTLIKNANKVENTLPDSISNELGITEQDVAILKQAMRAGATYYDSASKAGVENELLIWVQLKTDSKIVLPSFAPIIDVPKERTLENKTIINLKGISALLDSEHIRNHIEKAEIYFNPITTELQNVPLGARFFDIVTGEAMEYEATVV